MNVAPVKGKIVFRNGGVLCDTLNGFCSCGANHNITAYAKNTKEEILRAYLYYLIKDEGNK